MGKKIGIAVAVAIVVVVGTAVYLSVNAPQTNAPSAPVTGNTQQVLSDADADPDAIADAVLTAELDAEITPEEADPTLIASDETLVSEFDQSFNASQF